MNHYVMENLKKDIDKVLEEYAEKGVKDCTSLETVKTALSAKSKILTIEAMERVSESGFGRGRRANGQYMDSDYRDGNGNYRDEDGNYRDMPRYYRDEGGDYRDGGMEHLKKMLSRADPREREVIEKMLRKF